MCRIPGTQLVASATPEYTIRGSSRSLMSKRLVRHMCVLTVATGASSAREQDYYFTAQALTSMLQHGMRSMVRVRAGWCCGRCNHRPGARLPTFAAVFAKPQRMVSRQF